MGCSDVSYSSVSCVPCVFQLGATGGMNAHTGVFAWPFQPGANSRPRPGGPQGWPSARPTVAAATNSQTVVGDMLAVVAVTFGGTGGGGGSDAVGTAVALS